MSDDKPAPADAGATDLEQNQPLLADLSLGSELWSWLAFLRTLASVLLVVLGFILVAEVVRAYLTFRELGAPFGYAFLAVVGAVIAATLVRVVKFYRGLPVVLTPPFPNVAPESMSPAELRLHGDYLHQYMERLEANASVNGPERTELSEARRELASSLSERGFEKLLESTTRCQTTVDNALATVDVHAERIRRAAVRDVMIAVTLSPFRSADLVIVILRNAGMVLRIARLYDNKPLLSDQVRILIDVAGVVAAVNLLNFTEKFIESLAAGLPGFSQVSGDIAQGVGAGLMTSAAGRSAIHRCRAFNGWNKETACHFPRA